MQLTERDNRPTDQANAPQQCILLVEDSDVVRMLSVEVLKELGYQVIEAINAAQALQVLESDKKVDLLMTDIGLPGMNGKELVSAARQLRPRLKVLYASGYVETLEFKSSDPNQRTEVIGKPFSIEELRSTVHSILNS